MRMLSENDASIAKGPALLQRFSDAAQDATGGGPTQRGITLPSAASNGGENLVLLDLERLIRPIANNVVAIQSVLDGPQLRNSTGRVDDDKRLQAIRGQLLEALAAQNAALDVLAGFIDTQQMGGIEHSGEAYIGPASAATPSPGPFTNDPNSSALTSNPYTIDLTSVPGLTLGYNPITRLIDALHWTMSRAADRENGASQIYMASAALCG